MSNQDFTKQAIRKAFLELLNERSLSKITVRDITDRCGINRNTFYYHYQDMPALLEEICSIQVERIVADHPSISSFADCLDVIIKFALENKRAIMHIYYSDNRASYINALWRMCEQSVRTYVNTVFPDEDLSQRDRELIILVTRLPVFFAGMLFAAESVRRDALTRTETTLLLALL